MTTARTRTLVAVVIGLLSVAVAWKLRTIPVSTDPWHYVIAGMTFPERSWVDVGLTRYGMVLPMLVVAKLFHLSEVSFYLTPLLATGALAAATYWLTARWFGLWAGGAAVVLLMANSVFLVNATRMYPDVFCVAMIALAMVCAVVARDTWTSGGTGRRLLVPLVLCGTFVGLSWWMRETAVFSWPAVGLLLLWRGRPPVKLVLPAVGLPALGLLVAEMGISAVAFGDATLRFKALFGAQLSQTTNPADLPYLGQDRLTYLEIIPRTALLYADGPWMIAMAVLAVIGAVLFTRRVGPSAFWFLSVYALFTLIGGALRPEAPNIRLDVARYWIAFLPPMIIAAVGTASLLLTSLGRVLEKRTGSRRILVPVVGLVTVALLAGPLVASAREVRRNPAYTIVNGNELSEFRNWLAAHDAQVGRVYTDWTSARILPVYTRSLTGKRMSHVQFLSLGSYWQARAGDHVVIFSAKSAMCYFCRDVIDPFLAEHPRIRKRSWTEQWRSHDGHIVVYDVTRPPG